MATDGSRGERRQRRREHQRRWAVCGVQFDRVQPGAERYERLARHLRARSPAERHHAGERDQRRRSSASATAPRRRSAPAAASSSSSAPRRWSADDTQTCQPAPALPACEDIYVHDRDTGTTTRASVSSAGAQADGDSYEPHISSDGRFVVFESLATTLAAGGAPGVRHAFLRDRQNNTTIRLVGNNSAAAACPASPSRASAMTAARSRSAASSHRRYFRSRQTARRPPAGMTARVRRRSSTARRPARSMPAVAVLPWREERRLPVRGRGRVSERGRRSHHPEAGDDRDEPARRRQATRASFFRRSLPADGHRPMALQRPTRRHRRLERRRAVSRVDGSGKRRGREPARARLPRLRRRPRRHRDVRGLDRLVVRSDRDVAVVRRALRGVRDALAARRRATPTARSTST